MTAALEAHKNPPPAPQLTDKSRRAEDFAAAEKHRGCIHCHNVKEFRRAEQLAAGTWDRNDIWVYPLPENVGLTLEIDEGNRVKAVRPDSPAERAGVKPGDLVKSLNGQPVASFADATYGLHKAPAKGAIPITWGRGDRTLSASLEVADGWRKTDITWRPSMLDLIPSTRLFGGDDLTAAEKKQLGLAENRAAFRLGENVHPALAAAGLQTGDVIVDFDGEAVDGAKKDLLAHLQRNYLVGDAVNVNVVRSGKRVDLRLVLK
jgi:serine protease Do